MNTIWMAEVIKLFRRDLVMQINKDGDWASKILGTVVSQRSWIQWYGIHFKTSRGGSLGLTPKDKCCWTMKVILLNKVGEKLFYETISLRISVVLTHFSMNPTRTGCPAKHRISGAEKHTRHTVHTKDDFLIRHKITLLIREDSCFPVPTVFVTSVM